ncbi:hypothetical protein HDU93_003093 [Gonapodya sp. JEL0774]|nr:hypothetical protein HDU93_003093 [Gonapodya sp. JEL0774]
MLIHVKRAEDSQFLFETTTLSPIAEVAPQLTAIHNLRLKINRLIQATEDLVEHGVLKPENQQGLSEDQLKDLSSTNQDTNKNGDSGKSAQSVPKPTVRKNGAVYILNPDPTGRRCGEGTDAPPLRTVPLKTTIFEPLPFAAIADEIAEVVLRTIAEARARMSADLVKLKQPTTLQALTEALNNINGALMIAYPMGLPEYEPAREILDGTEDLSSKAISKELLDPKTCTLWWAGKELTRDKKLSDYVGRNEKTTAIVKLQKGGQGPPVRESPIDEAAQKQMMAYYFKKQEEHKFIRLKKLLENADDDYVNSQWADPKALKRSFVGAGAGVSWRPR